ncbi:MAG: endonuclease/exonuclease/phosphatase family protein, partial [Clostridia bacterium]|nr:endonuclease/exonuclease/phosphatase family protein [Clostridia bacterium]
GSKVSDLTYNGYVLYEMNGHIYAMGHTTDTIKEAANSLLNAITPDTCTSEDGKLTVTLPGSLISMKNPESYLYRDAKLLGESLSKYIIVLPANYTVYERFVADELIAKIGADTGYKLEYIKDSKMTVVEYRIYIGKTSYPYSTTVCNNVQKDGYLIQSEGKGVYIAFDNYLVSGETPEVIVDLYRANANTVNAAKTFDYSSYLFERPEDTSIRLMSNNVTVVQDAYSYERANDIEWTDRMEILAQMYLKYMPDFIGLQEVQYEPSLEESYYGSDYDIDMYGLLQEKLGHKYSMLGQTDRMTAIFYQTDVWKLEASGHGQFNAMHPWYWGLFSRVDDPTVQVIVLDIHYAGESVKFDHTNKYADGPAEYDGLTNGQVINIIYKELEAQYAGLPIFVMGDFNSKYTGGNFNATIKDTTLNSASKLVRDEAGNPAWGDHYTDVSLNHAMYADPIDHILVPTDKAEALAYRFINEGLMGISSGHRPIMADVKLYPVSSGAGNGMDWGNGVASDPK